MSKAQLVITAVVLEGRSKSEVARHYDVSRQWVQQLCKRYEADGDAPSDR
jgi:transposase